MRVKPAKSPGVASFQSLVHGDKRTMFRGQVERDPSKSSFLHASEKSLASLEKPSPKVNPGMTAKLLGKLFA
jgi:hypothetical protein